MEQKGLLPLDETMMAAEECVAQELARNLKVHRQLDMETTLRLATVVELYELNANVAGLSEILASIDAGIENVSNSLNSIDASLEEDIVIFKDGAKTLVNIVNAMNDMRNSLEELTDNRFNNIRNLDIHALTALDTKLTDEEFEALAGSKPV